MFQREEIAKEPKGPKAARDIQGVGDIYTDPQVHTDRPCPTKKAGDDGLGGGGLCMWGRKGRSGGGGR